MGCQLSVLALQILTGTKDCGPEILSTRSSYRIWKPHWCFSPVFFHTNKCYYNTFEMNWVSQLLRTENCRMHPSTLTLYLILYLYLHLILYFLTFLLYVNCCPRILFLVREKRAMLNRLTENCHNGNMSLFIVRKEDDFWNEDCIVQPDKDNQAHTAPTLRVNHEVNSSSHWTQIDNNLSRPRHKRLF